jgi:hypothetical protein
MPYRDGNPTLYEQFDADAARDFYTKDILKEAREDRVARKQIMSFIETIIGNLGAALIQRAPSDDTIIMEHIQTAYDAAKKVLIVVDDRPHTHAAGTMVGKNIDICAVCGQDIRHHFHSGQ